MKITTSYNKWQDLLINLQSHERLALACSGGLDSRLLAYAFKCANIDYKIVHIKGVHIPREEESILAKFSRESGIEVESFEMNPLDLEEVRNNNEKRCYFCKEAIFSFLLEKTKGYQLCDGTNTDDLTVYRPGLKALKELSIYSPFVEANINKADIRNLAKDLELPFAEQASQACLITRFNYGISPSAEELLWLDKSEEALSTLINTPFRLRCVSKGKWELHIEVENEETLLFSKNHIEDYIQEHLNAYLIDVIFVPSLRGYFDKNLVLDSNLVNSHLI